MATIGGGVQEIRIRDGAGAFRIIYVAKLADAVYVLHCGGKQQVSDIHEPKKQKGQLQRIGLTV